MCAIERLIKDKIDTVESVTAIAGALENVGGSQFEYEATRLNGSDSNGDSKKEGLRLVLKGGKKPLDGSVKREQKAIIEFLCDPKREGTEGEWESEDKYSKRRREEKDGDDKKDDGKKDDDKKDDGKEGDGGDKSFPEHQLKKDDAALIWESYGPEKDGDVLRLTWHTKHACEGKRDGNGDDNNGGDSSASWGFFTWLVIV